MLMLTFRVVIQLLRCVCIVQEFNKSDNALRNYRRIAYNRENGYNHGYANSQGYPGSHRGPGSQTDNQTRSYIDQNDQFDPPDTHNGTLVPSNSFNSGRAPSNLTSRNDAAHTAQSQSQSHQQTDQVPFNVDPGKQEATTSKPEIPAASLPRRNYASTPLFAPDLPPLSPSLLRGPMTSRQAAEIANYAAPIGVHVPLELSSITIETSRTPQLTQSILTSTDDHYPIGRGKESLIKTVTPNDQATTPKPSQQKQNEPVNNFESMPTLSSNTATKTDTQNPSRPPLPSVQVKKPAVEPVVDVPDVCLTYKQLGMNHIQMSDNERYKVYISHSSSPSIFW